MKNGTKFQFPLDLLKKERNQTGTHRSRWADLGTQEGTRAYGKNLALRKARWQVGRTVHTWKHWETQGHIGRTDHSKTQGRWQ